MNAISALLIVVIIAVSAGAGISESRRIRRRYDDLSLNNALSRARYLYIIIPAGLALLLSNISVIIIRKIRPSLFWAMPVWLEYHLSPLLWGSILFLFSFTFALTTAVAFSTSHRERSKILLSSIIFIVTILLVQWNYTRPVASKLKSEVSADGMVSQTSPVSCAAASGATIARLLGVRKSEKEMAELYGTSMLGTSPAQVIVGMKKIGIVSRKVESLELEPGRVSPPAMFFVDNPLIGQESHAVAYLGQEDGKFRIWDPLMGVLNLGVEGVEAIWRGRGIEFRRSAGP